MDTISVNEISLDPQGFLRRLEAGESFLVVRDSVPVAEVKPLPTLNATPRPWGLSAGQFTLPADFNDPLPEEVLRGFEE